MNQSIEVCGYNQYYGISEKLDSNRKTKVFIYPPIKSKFSASAVLSYSTYENKTIVVTIDGIAHCIGDNRNYEISCSLFRQIYEKFTEISLKDKDGDPCICISAVCGHNYTLYLISDGGKTNRNMLSISWSNCNFTYPLILNTVSSNPVALFGGTKDCAAIDDEGRILFVSEKIHSNPKSLIEAIYLPNKEKAVSVVMCYNSVLALSSCGRVYESKNEMKLSFRAVPDLKGKEFVRLSGINKCAFVIDAKGKVFVRGSNSSGQLGLDVGSVDCFTEILSLRNYKIVDVFAGPSHSFFKADNGKIFACGTNTWGELITGNERNGNCFYNPIETIINDGSFVISSEDSTIVFKNFIPSMIPNKQITVDFKSNSSHHQQKPDKNDSSLNKDVKEKDKQSPQNNKLKSQLEKEIEDQRRQLEELRDQIEHQKSQNTELKNQLTKEIKEKVVQKDQINVLENQMNEKNDQIEELQNQLENEMKEKEHQKNQIEELKKQIEKQSKEMNSQKLHYEKVINRLNQENEDKNSQIDNLKKQLNHITNSKEKIQDSTNKKIEVIEEEEFNKFEKIEKISSGGFGIVYKTIKTYAIKVMKIESIGEEEIRYFLNEYELINLLDHPNIIKTFGIYFGNKTNPPSILLEFCQMNLDQAINKKILSKIQVVFYVYQIVEGMKFVHFNKIIHRDLKPSNILIASDGTIKISDFGISKLMSIEEQSTMTKNVGTQKFMAPEIIDDNENYNEKVDVYSFGVLLFFIISEGQLPNIKKSEMFRGIKAEIPSYFTEFSKKLINDCWNLDPEKRPSFVDINNEIEKNDFCLFDLDKSELDEIKLLIRQHQEKIPFYSK